MPNPIEPLVKLQEVDTRLRALRSDVGQLATSVDAARDEANRVRERYESARTGLEAIEKRRRDVEGQLRDEEERTKTHRMRIERVRNEREAAAIRREVERGKEVIGLLEEEILQLFDTGEAKAKEVETLREDLTAKEETLAEREKLLAERQEALREQLDSTAAERAAVAENVEPGLVARYETVLRRCQGLAVVAVRSGGCAGCGLQIPPQLIMQIHRNVDVVSCPSCHRLLYVPPPADGGKD